MIKIFGDECRRYMEKTLREEVNLNSKSIKRQGIIVYVASILFKEEVMKRLMIVSAMLFVFSIPAYAQMGMMGGQQGQKGQGVMMGEGQQMMPMMEKCQQMMKQMMGDGMMKQEMMRMMMEMMNMQEKMMMGVKPAEKKEMMKDMASMRERMRNMMSMRMGMMMGMDDSQARLKCAEEWLKKAIDLHELHMKDPKTTTDASQMELMDQIKKAYGCIAGTGPDMSGTQSKEVEGKEPKKAEPSKTDPHKH